MSSDDELKRIREEKMKKLMNGDNTVSAKVSSNRAVDVNDNDFAEFVQQQGIVVVDTWAAWCMPCRSMAPIMDQLASEWGSQGVFIGKLNVDQNRRTAMKYNVSSIPNFLVFQNGKYLGNIVGAVGKKPFDQLFKKLLKGEDPTSESHV